ncbi:MAG: mandelate racemase/muconate lactonizing enzyme family protein [Paracoccaceae bacterium]|nr:mandelate racemase/muconate lactonizing enzyme family protein [Paracoccaceae bacterium]
MKIEAIETIYNKKWSNFCWVRVITEDRLTGLGETFRHSTPIITYIHDVIAPYLLGRDAAALARLEHDLRYHGGLRFLGYPTRSVEMRANSAINIALWDLKAQAAAQPLYQYLGGPVRDKIRIYNTCASPGYNWTSGNRRAQIADRDIDVVSSPSDDLIWQENDPGGLALSLLEEGITAMKIWPFDRAAESSGGQSISSSEMDHALSRIGAIRDTVGNRVDILMEYHSLWHQVTAQKILREVDAYAPFWHEDPIPMENLHGLAELRDMSSTPIAGSESHGTVTWVRDAIVARAIDYVHFDIGWVGGLSEALRVSNYAAAHDRLIAPHDCTGPVVWMANLHLALSQVNTLWLESVRAYYKGLYCDLVTCLPQISGGYASAPDVVGLGTDLSEFLLQHPDTEIKRSSQ